MSTPPLSVVLPVWKPQRDFLRAAVASVLTQTWEDFELLIVEDPSEVSAADLLQDLGDPRLRFLRNSKRTSLVAQLNLGLAEARAPWIARMDADDISMPRRFERQMQRANQLPDVDVIGTQIEIIDQNGRVVGVRSLPTEHDDILRALRRYNPISHPAVLLRRESVLELGGYGRPERVAQDYDLWARLACAGGRFTNLAETLLQYRLHQDAVKSRQVRETLVATIAIQREHLWHEMTLTDRAYHLTERAGLLIPTSLLTRAVRWMRYRK